MVETVTRDCLDIEPCRRRKSMAAIDEANLTVPMMKLELVPVPVADVDRAKAF